jgi:hypothetical protein
VHLLHVLFSRRVSGLRMKLRSTGREDASGRIFFAGSRPGLVMRGQKRVEDARRRAYDPRIHRKNVSLKSDGLPGQARQ